MWTCRAIVKPYKEYSEEVATRLLGYSLANNRYPIPGSVWINSTPHGPFHAWFYAQVFSDALDDYAQIARRGIAPMVEHPV